MLIITRFPGEGFKIGSNQEVEVIIFGENSNGAIKVGIKADREIPVLRNEVVERYARQALEEANNEEY